MLPRVHSGSRGHGRAAPPVCTRQLDRARARRTRRSRRPASPRARPGAGPCRSRARPAVMPSLRDGEDEGSSSGRPPPRWASGCACLVALRRASTSTDCASGRATAGPRASRSPVDAAAPDARRRSRSSSSASVVCVGRAILPSGRRSAVRSSFSAACSSARKRSRAPRRQLAVGPENASETPNRRWITRSWISRAKSSRSYSGARAPACGSPSALDASAAVLPSVHSGGAPVGQRRGAGPRSGQITPMPAPAGGQRRARRAGDTQQGARSAGTSPRGSRPTRRRGPRTGDCARDRRPSSRVTSARSGEESAVDAVGARRAHPPVVRRVVQEQHRPLHRGQAARRPRTGGRRTPRTSRPPRRARAGRRTSPARRCGRPERGRRRA